MATPAEIVARWDKIEAMARERARARSRVANDNAPREPDGYIEIDGERVAYWLPPAAKQKDTA